MADNVAILLGGLAGVAGVTGATTLGIAMARRPRPYLPAGHALVGDDIADPLPDVLRRGLAGISIPVRPGPQGELYLGTPRPGQTLRRLVLAPLFARAKARGGRLCKDQRVPFRLVVEFAGPTRDAETLLRAYRLLDQQLRDHARMLSHCLDGRLNAGAVTVVVAGIVNARELLATQRERYAFADGSFEDIGAAAAPPTLVPMISEHWTRRFGWDGCEEIPAEERHQLHALVRSAHEDGRTVRFAGLPSGSRKARQAVWTELGEAGVDAIADADQTALARHLRRHPVRLPLPPMRRPSPQPRRSDLAQKI
ncbi:hypothetical protein [Actinoplanes sp. NPDC051859]|uniref:hypothetical protein n=1 Tax=Actinoplanes sp. NPDC051859 TaxID=3363909 RepID=UPI0037B58F23